MEPIPVEHLAPTDETGIGSWRMSLFDGRRSHHESKPVQATSVPTVDLSCDEAPHADLTPGDWAAVFTATLRAPESGAYKFVVEAFDNYMLWIDDQRIDNGWDLNAPVVSTREVTLQGGHDYAIRLELRPGTPGGLARFGWVPPGAVVTTTDNPHQAAVELAKSCDAVLIFAGTNHLEDTEGRDRPSFDLGGGQNDLIAQVIAANPNTAVFLNGGNPSALPWADQAPAIVQTFYAGMEGGRSIVDVAFGDVNPSGKLPFTWFSRLEDYPAHNIADYQAEFGNYTEGWRVGYRHAEADGPTPLFPFGHGLSYTTFTITDLAVEAVNEGDICARVTVTVSNTGNRRGAEVVQVYLGDDECSVDRPNRELKAFSKEFLDPGESLTLTYSLSKRDLSFYDVETQSWVVEPGTFTVSVDKYSASFRYQAS